MHPADAVHGFGCSQQVFCNANGVCIDRHIACKCRRCIYVCPADAMKPLNVLSKIENHFAIRTVRFQVQLEADGYFFFFFFAQEVFAFASTASRASRYHLASFEPDFFTNPASKHLLGFAQTRYSAQNCAGYTFPLIPNKQIFLEKNLFYENLRWFIQYCIKPELLLPVLKAKSGSITS